MTGAFIVAPPRVSGAMTSRSGAEELRGRLSKATARQPVEPGVVPSRGPMAQWAAFLAYLLLATATSASAFSKHTAYPWLMTMAYASVLLFVGVWLWRTGRRAGRNTGWPLTAALVLVAALAIANASLYPSTRVGTARSSAPDALIDSGSRLLAGEYPYARPLFDGALISPGPGWVVLQAPLTRTGLIWLMLPIHLALACYMLSRRTGAGAFAFCVLVLAMPAFLQMSFVGHDLFAVGCAMVVVTLAVHEQMSTSGRALLLWAFLASVVASARVPFAVFVGALSLLALARDRRAGALFAIVSIGSLLALHVFFYAWGHSLGRFYHPLHVLNRADAGAGPAALAIGLMLSVTVGVWAWRRGTDTAADWLCFVWVTAGVPFAAVGVGELVRVNHLDWAAWEGKVYAGFALPLLIAALVLHWCATPERKSA